VRDVSFRGLFGFKYSPRPKTPALRLGDDVPESVKSDRLARLFELSESLLGAHLAALVGSTQSVLIDGPGRDRDPGTGRTERNEIVHIADARGHDLLGQIVSVSIVRAYRHSLLGELTADARAALPVTSQPARRRSLPVARLPEG